MIIILTLYYILLNLFFGVEFRFYRRFTMRYFIIPVTSGVDDNFYFYYKIGGGVHKLGGGEHKLDRGPNNTQYLNNVQY